MISTHVVSTCNQPPVRDSQSTGGRMYPYETFPNKRGPGKYPSILTLTLLFKPLHFMLLPNVIMPITDLSFDEESRCFFPALLSRPC